MTSTGKRRDEIVLEVKKLYDILLLLISSVSKKLLIRNPFKREYIKNKNTIIL